MIAAAIFSPIALAQVGIPNKYIPDNAPMKELLKTNSNNVSTITGEVGANYILQKLANGLIYFAAPLAVLFVAHAGVSYGMAAGENSKLEAAKKELMWAIIGLFAIMTSFFLIRFMITFFFTATGSGLTPVAPAG